MRKLLCTLALLSSMASQAASLVYDFSYAAGSGILAGQLEGELQADGNTVLVSAVHDFVTVNGVSSAVSLPRLGHWEPIDPFTWDYVFGGPTMVSFDGSTMNLAACPADSCVDAFFFMPAQLFFPAGLFISTGALGLGAEAFNPAHWSLTAAVAVPTPGTLALMTVALASLLAFRRRAA
jgi:hypothetical protein